MKLLLLTPILLLSLSLSAFSAESTVQKVEEDVAQAAEKTEATVKKTAKKTGEAVDTAAKKTGKAVKTGTDEAVKATEGAADKVAKTTKKTVDDVANSELYQKIEKALGKPFTPEQKAKYAEAWNAAQEKARATEQEFADKISEITGLGKRKSKKVVSEQGL